MGSETIKSFLVGLGFGVDQASLKAFNKAIESASIRIAALYGSIQLAAAGIFKSISSASQGFEDMGYQLRIVAPAMNRWLVMRQAMLEAYSKAGVNLTQVVRQAILFNYSLAKTKFALEAVYKSVAAKFFPLLTKQMDIFRGKIFANMPKIQSQLTKFVEFVFKAFGATVELGERLWSVLTRVWDFFVKLDRATNGWSTAILAVVAAWKFLNLSFLATPFGMIIAGLTALLTLYDDLQVWREGGKSLFDWGSSATRTVVGIAAAVAGLLSVVGAIIGALRLWAAAQALVNIVMLANPLGLIIAGVTALIALITALAVKLGYLKGVGSFFEGLGEKTIRMLSGPNASAAMNSIQQPSQPLMPGGAQSTQNVSQQTHITVNGAADANQVGKQVVGNQDRVNFDLTRNLKGAMQ